jgi:hypothetical protein
VTSRLLCHSRHLSPVSSSRHLRLASKNK